MEMYYQQKKCGCEKEDRYSEKNENFCNCGKGRPDYDKGGKDCGGWKPDERKECHNEYWRKECCCRWVRC